MSKAIVYALAGTIPPFIATMLGAAVVFLFKDEVSLKIQRAFLGFAAGVMTSALVFSLLIPAMDMAEAQGVTVWIPAAGGFALGGLFLFLLDHIMPHIHVGSDTPMGPKAHFGKSTMLVIAVTLHNIPEGMAVGLSFAMAAQNTTISLAGAIALSVGIALQNFPEGAAISLPLKQEGFSNGKAFLYGSLSGIVEPIAAVVAVLMVGTVEPLMPWLLAFAAGAMLYVVVDDLIPQAHLDHHAHTGTIGVMAGFVIMMVLDVALG